MHTSAATLASAGAALILGTVAAWAADVPANRSTTATVTPVGSAPESDNSYRGVFDFAGDSDWYRVKLKAGQEIAVGTLNTFSGVRVPAVRLRIYGPGGANVTRDPGDTSVDFDGGAWARATKAGWHYVEVRQLQPGPAATYPYGYRFAVSPDCGADAETSCRLKLGATEQKFLVTQVDVDWLALSLTAGKAYDVVLAEGDAPRPSAEPYVRIVNKSGRSLAGGSFGEAGGIFGFRPATTGTYFAVISTDDDYGTEYKITLRNAAGR